MPKFFTNSYDLSVTKTVHLVPTLCVGMQTGRSASGSVRRKTVSGNRKQDAERPGCIPTQSVGTRSCLFWLHSYDFIKKLLTIFFYHYT
ncbi:MAG: hypothetical protein GY749_08210 [Desulfobacteraceae bacterium]|nr:hypothetical protein [Desulfobacteraceae bacterium]